MLHALDVQRLLYASTSRNVSVNIFDELARENC